MRTSWMCAVVALVLAGGAGSVRAGDIDDAQLARQCPGMDAWIQAHKAEAARGAPVAAPPGQPALRAELLRMGKADQQVRDSVIADGGKHPASIKAMLAVDARNLPRIRQIDAAQGFPTLAQVGHDGLQAAWLLVQHADSDPGFQLHVLQELQVRADHGGVGAQGFAMLTDRVLVGQQKPQRYGTQLTMKNGKLQPDPIEDRAGLEHRRAAAGLPPLADYACLLRLSYGRPPES